VTRNITHEANLRFGTDPHKVPWFPTIVARHAPIPRVNLNHRNLWEGYGFLPDYPSACPEVDHSENDCSALEQFDAETVLAVVHGAEAVLAVVHGADEAVPLVSPGTAVQLPCLTAS
jgi:hypothetical protein